MRRLEHAPPIAAVAKPARDEVRRREAHFRRALALADVVATAVALLVIVGLGDDKLTPVLLLAPPVIIGVSKLLGLYDRDRDVLAKSTLDEAPALLQLALLYTLTLSIGSGLLVDGYLGSMQALGLLTLLFTMLLLARATARGMVLGLSAPERCLIVASPALADRVRSKIESSRFVNAEVVGILDIGGHTDRAALEAISQVIADRSVHRVVVAPAADDVDYLNEIRVIKAAGVRVSLVPRLFEVVGSSVRFDDVDGLTLVGVPEFGLTRSSRLIKRSFDLLVSSLALLVLAPLLAAIAIAVKVSSPGPVLFRQPRVGWAGREFQMLKFRSMVADAEEQKEGLLELNEAGDGLFKIANDPRITKVGVLLRRLSLDEVPQLINVLKGDMSLVGPRPLVPEDDRHVEGLDRRRLAVPPGMTGVWQVLGSSRVPMREMVKLDYLYAANWSLWTDVKLLIRTVPLLYSRNNR